MNSSSIMFFQSTSIGGDQEHIGLFELLCSHLNALDNKDIFKKIQIVVPNQAMASWLKDNIAKKFGICANIDFVVLMGPVIQSIYCKNNEHAQLFDFSYAKYIIYQYLCENKLNTPDSQLLNNYIYVSDIVDKLRVYKLSSQLQEIFTEYMYLRTNELLNLKAANFPEWQKQILRHLFDFLDNNNQQANHKWHTFLDIYSYFMKMNTVVNVADAVDTINSVNYTHFPDELFIFGLTTIYPSQLQIIKQLAKKTKVYWYYKACSYDYYGDLLSNFAKDKLEKKLLKYPDLSLDDLYLTDGNQLLANLGQQSREFLELLQANDIVIYDFKVDKQLMGNNTLDSDNDTNAVGLDGNLDLEVNVDLGVHVADTMLKIIQEDIYQIKYRINPKYRLSNTNNYYADDYYADPILLDIAANPNSIDSIKINSCHNKMREVQVMFNEIANILNVNSELALNEILVCAPDIDDYADYISAVFDNEVVQSADGVQHKILYNITGNRSCKNYKILDAVKLIINFPYALKVSYLIEIITQTEIRQGLNISQEDVDLIKQWLFDNAIHFGFDAQDYTKYGYIDYPIHSFTQWLNNIALGVCISEEVFIENNQLPLYKGDSGCFCPYDNLDSNQMNLANKILFLINQLFELRSVFYIDENTYRELTMLEVYSVLNNLYTNILHSNLVNSSLYSSSITMTLICEQFLSSLVNINLATPITLPIINILIEEYVSDVKRNLRFNGTITCASMQYMRNIPYSYIYILGMNFGEFPRSAHTKQINILSKEWHLADRNYNIEDKQIFLDMILAAKKALYISYIGRCENDNSEIKPSTLLNLLINTIGESFINFWDDEQNIIQKFNFKNIIYQQSLHPFYNNSQANFSCLWAQATAYTMLASASSLDNNPNCGHWDFRKVSPIKLNEQQKSSCLQPSLKNLTNTFVYTNVNLYKVLGIDGFNREIELDDLESLTVLNRKLAKNIYYYLEKYFAIMPMEELYQFLFTKGVLSYGELGKLQFAYYTRLYGTYIQLRGNKEANLALTHKIYVNKNQRNKSNKSENWDSEDILLNINDTVWIEEENNSIIVVSDFFDIRDEPLAKKLADVAYEQKIRGLIISAIIMHSGYTGRLNKVIIRQINSTGESRDFVVAMSNNTHKTNNINNVNKSSEIPQDNDNDININNNDDQLDRIVAYYLRSLTNPVLIHRGAIEEYVEAAHSRFKDGSLKYAIEQKLDKARVRYHNQFAYNPDLDKIRQDIIFAPIADIYFDYIANVGGINDIKYVGEILSNLKDYND